MTSPTGPWSGHPTAIAYHLLITERRAGSVLVNLARRNFKDRTYGTPVEVVLSCGNMPKLTDLMELASYATGVDVDDMLLAKYIVWKDGRCEPGTPLRLSFICVCVCVCMYISGWMRCIMLACRPAGRSAVDVVQPVAAAFGYLLYRTCEDVRACVRLQSQNAPT